MSRVSTYLNFMGTTEEAFDFYSAAFGTEVVPPVTRWGDMPASPGAPELSEAERKLIAHIDLPILAGHMLIGTDALASRGETVEAGTNVTILLEPDTRSEADRLYGALSEGAHESTGLQAMPWAYTGTCVDRFGIRWMFNCFERAS
jgi:PhnB protein